MHDDCRRTASGSASRSSARTGRGAPSIRFPCDKDAEKGLLYAEGVVDLCTLPPGAYVARARGHVRHEDGADGRARFEVRPMKPLARRRHGPRVRWCRARPARRSCRTPGDARSRPLSPDAARSQERLREGQRLMGEDKFTEAAAALSRSHRDRSPLDDGPLRDRHRAHGAEGVPGGDRRLRGRAGRLPEARRGAAARSLRRPQAAREDRIRNLQDRRSGTTPPPIASRRRNGRSGSRSSRAWRLRRRPASGAPRCLRRACRSRWAARTSAPAGSPTRSGSTGRPSRRSRSSASRASISPSSS